MSSLVSQPSTTTQHDAPAGDSWVRIKSWDEVDEIFAKHLTPVKYSPKGWPICALRDIDALCDKLHIRLPEDI